MQSHQSGLQPHFNGVLYQEWCLLSRAAEMCMSSIAITLPVYRPQLLGGLAGELLDS
jgi:hypothetical protein